MLDSTRPQPLMRKLAALQALAVTVWRSDPVRFIGHFLEMVVAMMAGMLPLGVLYMTLSPAMPFLDEPAVGAALMAIFMAVPMVAWMRRRGHTWRQAGEMSAAMLAPSVPLMVADLWGPAHVAMLLGMLALMLYRRDEYLHAGCHNPSQMTDGRAQAVGEPRHGTRHATGRTGLVREADATSTLG